MLQPNSPGNYHFLPGSDPYSCGVVADPGFEIVHVTLRRPVPYRAGFARIDEQLRTAGRSRRALCAVELRSPAPFTRAGFIEFNRGYCALLEEWDLLIEGQNPIARTNVAPEFLPPPAPALFGFSYTAIAKAGTPRTFVVAGGGDLQGGPLLEAQVVRPGETSPEAMAEKAAQVMGAMISRLEALGVSWAEVSTINVYTVQVMDSLIRRIILEAARPAAIRGIHRYYARPPIDELEFEMDVRGVCTDLYL